MTGMEAPVLYKKGDMQGWVWVCVGGTGVWGCGCVGVCGGCGWVCGVCVCVGGWVDGGVGGRDGDGNHPPQNNINNTRCCRNQGENQKITFKY